MKRKKSRPDVRELSKLYKGFYTIHIQNRITVLSTALQLYDSWMSFVEQKPLSEEQLKAKLEVNKFRNLATQCTTPDSQQEKERHLCSAILHYEFVCQRIHPILLTPVLLRFNKLWKKFSVAQERTTKKFAKFLVVLTNILGPVNYKQEKISFVVNSKQELPRQMSNDLRTISYSLTAVRQMRKKFKREGLLPLVRQEMEWISHVCSLVPNGAGKYGLLPARNDLKGISEMVDRRVGAYNIMLSNLETYLRSNKLARRVIVRIQKEI